MPEDDKTHFLKVAIIEDHSLVRQAFKNLVNHYPECNVVLEAEDGSKFLKALKQKSIAIDVLLLDLFSPQMDGRDALKTISELYPLIKVLVLSACNDQKIINGIFELGAYGFISKNAESEELHDAIVTAANNRIYQNQFFQLHRNVALSPPETRLLELMWLEKTNEEIARVMCLSISGIEKIKHQLKAKTNTKTTVGLIKYALERRIIIPGQE
jgi:DNA-binding NarL/FixJ family response regulator